MHIKRIPAIELITKRKFNVIYRLHIYFLKSSLRLASPTKGFGPGTSEEMVFVNSLLYINVP